MITHPVHGKVNDRSLVNSERCALKVAEPQSIALSFEIRVIWGETLAPAHLRQFGPSCRGLGQMGVHTMHSTGLSQLTLHASSLTLFIDRVLEWTTKEAWFHFPP